MTVISSIPVAASSSIASIIVPAVCPAMRTPSDAAPVHNVTELHFLVHPLFVGDPFRKKDGPWIERGMIEAKGMAQRYEAHARSLCQGGVLCAFLHVFSDDLAARKDAFGPMLIQFVQNMHALLGPRVMFFGADVDPFHDYRVVRIIRREMRRRGLAFGRTVRHFAYGEVLQECVKEAAENLREGFAFRQRTRIPINLTEAVLTWNDMNRIDQRRLRREFREAGLTLVEDIPQDSAASKHVP